MGIKNKNLQVVGLRGLACLMVVLYHLIYRFQELYTNTNYNQFKIAYWGQIGVIIFMTLSAYYIYNERNSFINLKYYYFKKFLRLWPAYFVSITLIFVFINIIGLPDRTTNFFEYILNIFLLNGFIGIPYVDGAHWYLTNLIILIIISSILLKYSIITKIWPYAVWIVTGLFIKYIGLNSITKLICGKYIGVIIAAIMLNAIKNESNIKMKKKYFFLLQICYVYNFTNGYVFAIISIISNLIVYIVMEEKFKFLNNKVLVYIGEISYPLYLVHQNISMSIEYILYNYFHQSYYIWFAFIAIIVSVIIASIIHNKIEKNEKTLNFLFELLSFEK